MSQVRISRKMAALKRIEVFYRDTGTDGPAILCLHGRWGRGETWVEFMEHYGKDYRILAPDQRGHGLSSKPIADYSAEEMAGDMAEFLEVLNLKSVILVGHSMGGRVAGYFAALHPESVSALAILDRTASGPSKARSMQTDSEPAVDPLTKDWPMPFPTLAAAQTFLRQEMESDLSYRYFMNSLVETVEGYQMMFSPQAMAANIAHEEDWFHLLPKIKCPVLLVRAKGGGAVPDADFHKMKTSLADCVAHTMSNPDHNVHLSDPEEFYAVVDTFLEKIRH